MSEAQKGILAMVGACLIWGCMPLIYKPLVHVRPDEVMAHRVIWSLVFYALLLMANGRWNLVEFHVGPTDVSYSIWPEIYGVPAYVIGF